MKKILSLVFLLQLSATGFGQHKFYTTVQAGPSLSFSNKYAYAEYSSPHAKLTSNFGVGFGYIFPNQFVQAETGFYKTFSYVVFELEHKNFGRTKKEDKVLLRWSSWQVPVRLKMKLWQPSDKLALRALTGVIFSFTPANFKFSDNVINVKGAGSYDQISFQTRESALWGKRYYFSKDWNWGLLSTCQLETGLEASYSLSENVSGQVILAFQNGLQTRYAATVFKEDTDPETGQRYLNRVTKAASDGNALYLNFGLTYAF